MISVETIKDLIYEELVLNDLFVVDVVVNPGNKIVVLIDSIKGVTIEECIKISRFVEKNLDREKEDYELEVSSPGLDRPLRIPKQYEKNTGRILGVVKTDGIKITGKLIRVSEEAIYIETVLIKRDQKTRKKNTELMITKISFNEIKTAKVELSNKKN
jgi:ribosome maturation factor RimP